MALRNAGNQPTSTPAFEDEEPDTVASAPVAAPAPAPEASEAPASAKAKVEATKAVATAAATSSGAVAISNRSEASAFAKEVQEMKGAADFGYGNFKVFKGNNGEIMETGGDRLGRWVKVSMVAWDDHWEVSPGSKSEKSKEAVGYSKGGKTMDSIIGSDYSAYVGKSIDDYLKFLQTDEDYPSAKKGRFVDIACIVHEADSEDKFNGEVIQVTLSQSSIPSFSSYQETLAMKARAAARGIPGIKIPEDPFTFYFLRDVTTKGENTWTKLKVVTSLPAKL